MAIFLSICIIAHYFFFLFREFEKDIGAGSRGQYQQGLNHDDEALSMERRIGIRPLMFSDALDVYENVKDKDIVRWTMTIPHPYPKDGALKFIRKSRHNMRKRKSYAFGITLSDNKKRAGKVIGVVDLMNVDWAEKNAEIGYWLGKRYWNKGLMTEAVELMLDHGFGELRLHRVYATLFDKNIGSKKILEKSGFKLEGRRREARYRYGKWHDVLMYGILRSEFKRPRSK